MHNLIVLLIEEMEVGKEVVIILLLMETIIL